MESSPPDVEQPVSDTARPVSNSAPKHMRLNIWGLLAHPTGPAPPSAGKPGDFLPPSTIGLRLPDRQFIKCSPIDTVSNQLISVSGMLANIANTAFAKPGSGGVT